MDKSKKSFLQNQLFSSDVTVVSPKSKYMAEIKHVLLVDVDTGENTEFYEVAKMGIVKRFQVLSAAQSFAEKNIKTQYVSICAHAWGLKVKEFKLLLVRGDENAMLAYEKMKDTVEALKLELAEMKR